MPKQHTVYAIRSDGRIVYCGMTSQILRARLSNHKRAKKDGNRSHWADFVDAAVSRGAEITIHELDTADTKADALKLEAAHTQRLIAQGHNLQNRSIAGKYAAESRAAISAATRRQTFAPGIGGIAATPVMNLDTGFVYQSISEAARAIGRGQPTLTLAIKNGRRCAGFRFAKLELASLGLPGFNEALIANDNGRSSTSSKAA